MGQKKYYQERDNMNYQLNFILVWRGANKTQDKGQGAGHTAHTRDTRPSNVCGGKHFHNEGIHGLDPSDSQSHGNHHPNETDNTAINSEQP